MSDEELIEQLRAELQRAHAATVVPPGSAQATVRTAHRRRRRRRILAGTGAVAVVSGALLVATRSGDDAGTLVSGDGAPSTDAAVAAVPPTTQAFSKTPETSMPESAGVPPAQLIDSGYEWTEVTPPADQQAGADWAGPVPGVVVGPDAVYYTDDAVAFQRLTPTPPSGTPVAWLGDGATLYAAGADVAGALMVDVSTDQGVTWASVALPVDPHALDGLPHVEPVTRVDVVRTDTAPLVSVQLSAALDTSGIAVPDGTLGQLVDTTGVTFFVDTCDATAAGTAPCEPVVMTWDELGIDATAAAAITSATTRLFDVSSGAAVEVALPEGYVSAVPFGDRFVYLSSDHETSALYTYGSAGWEPAPVPDDWTTADVVPVHTSTHVFALTRVGEPGEPALASTTGDVSTYVRLGDLVAGAQVEPLEAVAGDDVVAMTAQVRVDAFADGPIEVTSGEVTVQRAAGEPDWLVLDASGEQIVGTSIEYTDAGFDVIGPQGDTLATFDAAARDLLSDDLPLRSWAVLTSSDGVHVAVDDAAELFGVDGATITATKLTALGDELVLTIALDDGTARTAVGRNG